MPQWLFIYSWLARILQISYLNYDELVNSHRIPALEIVLSFAYDFQRHKQEMTQVELVLQNKVN